MAATVVIISAHGATVTTTETDITSATIKFKKADNDTNDTLTPVAKPAAGTNYSWRKSLRIKVTATPDGDISNLRFFSDAGSWGTGVKMHGHSKPTANYDQASSADESAEIAQDGGSAVNPDVNEGTSPAAWTSGAPLSLNSAGIILSNPSTGYGTQDLVELQIGVGTTATRGTKGPRTYTYRFDET